MPPIRPAAATPGDDLPVFDEAPLRTFELRPQPIRPGNRRGSLIAGAWASALAVLAGVGILTGGSGPPPNVPRVDAVPRADAAAPDGALDVLGAYPPAGYPGARRRDPLSVVTGVVALDAPAPAHVEVTTPLVEVRGSVLVRATRVAVALEAPGNLVLQQVSIDVSDPHGGIRPERAPTFRASFDLPFPHQGGTMWIVVRLYDAAGLPLGGTRRAFSVRRLLAPGAAESTVATEDVPFPDQRVPARGAPPRCLPTSPTRSSTC